MANKFFKKQFSVILSVIIIMASVLIWQFDSPKTASAAVAFDASATSITTGFNGGPVTKTWTQGCHSCTLIVLTADIWQDTGPVGTITAASFNGTGMTFVASSTEVSMESEIWYINNPTQASSTVSVTVTGATDAIKMATSSYTGTNTSAPLDQKNTIQGTSGNPSISLTSVAANAVVVDTLSRFSTTNATTAQTVIYNDHATSVLGAASYQLATTSGTYSDTYTGTAAQDWSMAIASFKQGSTSSLPTYTRVSIPRGARLDVVSGRLNITGN